MSDPCFAHYQRVSGLVLGFHGCDRAVGEAVLADNRSHLNASNNPWDWLGNGIYFWENDPQRALEFAQEAMRNSKKSAGRIKEPFVVGAVIDLGLCLNFLERSALIELEEAFAWYQTNFQPNAQHKAFPQNQGEDRGARFLDAAIIDTLHKLRTNVKYPPYDTVRGAFWEGGELYPGAGFDAKSHIQIAVRSTDCIKGYFRPLLQG